MTDRWQPEPRARVVNVNIMPIAIDTFLIRFSTPFRHLYIWSRRFFGNILASISTIFDTIFDPFSASLHVESSIFRMHFDVDFDIFLPDFRSLFVSTLFWYDFRPLFGTFTYEVVDFSDAFLRRFRHTFLTWVWTPFQHFYIWSRRFFGSILASISTLFDTIFKNVRTSQLAYSADATSPQH